MKTIIAIGEAMIEFSPASDDLHAMGFAGDTFNTATYLARAFPGRLSVEYMSALGIDPFSDRIADRARDEGIGTRLIRRIPGRSPGLYVIDNDPSGERSFQYWRQDSAARDMLRGLGEDVLAGMLGGADAIYFSGITLAILPSGQRTRLLAALGRCTGTLIGFDPNYRPALWSDAAEAARACRTAAATATLCLVTAGDDAALFGPADAGQIGARWAGWGCGEVVVKDGAKGCTIFAGGRTTAVPVPRRRHPVDTTGAGDSFAAGYLGARLLGAGPASAATYGHRLAGTVVCHKGGTINRTVPLPRF